MLCPKCRKRWMKLTHWKGRKEDTRYFYKCGCGFKTTTIEKNVEDKKVVHMLKRNFYAGALSLIIVGVFAGYAWKCAQVAGI